MVGTLKHLPDTPDLKDLPPSVVRFVITQLYYRHECRNQVTVVLKSRCLNHNWLKKKKN